MTEPTRTDAGTPQSVTGAPRHRARYRVRPSVPARALAPTADPPWSPGPKPGPYTPGPPPKEAA